jgi:hypothetical protein
MPTHSARRALPLLLAFLLPACGSSSTTAATATRAVLAITVNPNPVIVTRSANPAFDYDAQWTVVLTETAGLGADVNFVDSAFFDPATGIQVAQNDLDSSDLLVLTGSKHIPPKGTLSVQQTVSYTLPSRGRSALLTVNVQLKDDNQNLIDQSALVQVQ